MSTLRIRKLTPNECIRLMAFESEDERSMREINMTDSAIYHCAGDSVVVNCWLAIVGSMLPISEEELKKIIEDYTERVKGE